MPVAMALGQTGKISILGTDLLQDCASRRLRRWRSRCRIFEGVDRLVKTLSMWLVVGSRKT